MAVAGPESLLQLNLIKPMLRLMILWHKMDPKAKVRPMKLIRLSPVATKIRVSPVTKKAIRMKKTPQTLILQLMRKVKTKTKSTPQVLNLLLRRSRTSRKSLRSYVSRS